MAGRVVAILTGMVLLFASLMKGLALADTTVSSGRVPGDWWLSLAASVFELLLGAWLIVGVFPVAARRVALVCFLGFAGVALFKAIRGEVSCGCFGSIAAAPWLIFALDVAIVFALFRFPPAERNPPPDRIRIGLVCSVVGLAVLLGVGARWDRVGRTPLRAVPDRIDLGVIDHGGASAGVVRVTNRGSAAIRVT